MADPVRTPVTLGQTAIGAALLGVSIVVLQAASALPAGLDGRLRSIAPMGAARAAHTATALPNGDVLIMGGFGEAEGRAAGAEVFDSEAERFTSTGQPGLARQSHAATRLADGTVLVSGGLTGDGRYTASAEIYDPSTRAFRPVGAMAVGRSGHEAVLMADGRVLVVGGVGTGWTFLASAEIYDPATARFTATGSMRELRESHVAVRLPDGRVLVAGGHRGRGAAIVISRTAEVFDPATGRFDPVSPMDVRRHKHDAIALADGRVLILGGADERDNDGAYTSVEVFDPATGRFAMAAPLRMSRYKHRGTTFRVPGGGLLVAGGAARAEEYDPASGEGRILDGEATLAGQFSAAAVLPGGRILVTGGYGDGKGPGPTAWIYDQDSGRGAPHP